MSSIYWNIDRSSIGRNRLLHKSISSVKLLGSASQPSYGKIPRQMSCSNCCYLCCQPEPYRLRYFFLEIWRRMLWDWIQRRPSVSDVNAVWYRTCKRSKRGWKLPKSDLFYILFKTKTHWLMRNVGKFVEKEYNHFQNAIPIHKKEKKVFSDK